MASIKLRSLIDNVVKHVSDDVMRQAGEVEDALKRRVGEMEEVKRSLEDELKKVGEIF